MFKYIEKEKKVECIWEHISNDSYKEKDFCKEKKPLIQNHNTAYILSDFKHKKEKGTWKDSNDNRIKAESEIFEILKELIK